MCSVVYGNCDIIIVLALTRWLNGPLFSSNQRYAFALRLLFHLHEDYPKKSFSVMFFVKYSSPYLLVNIALNAIWVQSFYCLLKQFWVFSTLSVIKFQI